MKTGTSLSKTYQHFLKREQAQTERALTTQETQHLEKLERIHELVESKGIGTQLNKAVKKAFPGSSARQVRQWIADAEHFFSLEYKPGKTIAKKFHNDACSDALSRIMKDESFTKDPKMITAFTALMKEFREGTKFNEVELDLPDFSKEGTIMVLQIDPEKAGIPKVENEAEIVADILNKFDNGLDVEDVDFEEVESE